MEPDLVRKADLARALGVNRAIITRAGQAGRLVPAADPALAAAGWYQSTASLARFRATRGARLDLVEHYAATRAQRPQDAAAAPDPHASSAPPAAAPPAPAQRPPRPPPVPGVGLDRATVKGQILATENAITKLEIALARGRRLQLADVSRESFTCGQRLADHLRRVIDQVAARLAAVTDPAERQRLLHPELRRVRRAFDQAGIASLRHLKGAGRRASRS